MKYYLIAGEASGDLHASNLMAALKENDPKAEFRFLGGDLMRAVGGTLVKHYREMAFMGFIPVLLNLRTILNNMKTCQEDIRRYQPDVVILIDYPGFNLKIAICENPIGSPGILLYIPQDMGLETIPHQGLPALCRSYVLHPAVRDRVFPEA